MAFIPPWLCFNKEYSPLSPDLLQHYCLSSFTWSRERFPRFVTSSYLSFFEEFYEKWIRTLVVFVVVIRGSNSHSRECVGRLDTTWNSNYLRNAESAHKGVSMTFRTKQCTKALCETKWRGIKFLRIFLQVHDTHLLEASRQQCRWILSNLLCWT